MVVGKMDPSRAHDDVVASQVELVETVLAFPIRPSKVATADLLAKATPLVKRRSGGQNSKFKSPARDAQK
jgi:hypothetical protein